MEILAFNEYNFSSSVANPSQTISDLSRESSEMEEEMEKVYRLIDKIRNEGLERSEFWYKTVLHLWERYEWLEWNIKQNNERVLEIIGYTFELERELTSA